MIFAYFVISLLVIFQIINVWHWFRSQSSDWSGFSFILAIILFFLAYSWPIWVRLLATSSVFAINIGGAMIVRQMGWMRRSVDPRGAPKSLAKIMTDQELRQNVIESLRKTLEEYQRGERWIDHFDLDKEGEKQLRKDPVLHHAYLYADCFIDSWQHYRPTLSGIPWDKAEAALVYVIECLESGVPIEESKMPNGDGVF